MEEVWKRIRAGQEPLTAWVLHTSCNLQAASREFYYYFLISFVSLQRLVTSYPDLALSCSHKHFQIYVL